MNTSSFKIHTINKEILNKILEKYYINKEDRRFECKIGLNSTLDSIDKLDYIFVAPNIIPEKLIYPLLSKANLLNKKIYYMDNKENIGKILGINKCSALGLYNIEESIKNILDNNILNAI